ncbi:MAG: hypothetical protein JWO08_3010, partial [Verrucomicrobiaceae bacterium]|nr:hypothetical protein [Verrucomicrobiaceae bacterium]
MPLRLLLTSLVASLGILSVAQAQPSSSPEPPPITAAPAASPPVVTRDPVNTVLDANRTNSSTISVIVTGLAPFTFQWQRDGEDYGAPVQQQSGTHFLSLPTVPSSAGKYRCVITNADGTATSAEATITVVPYPPVVLFPPNSWVAVADGNRSAWLSVTVLGHTPYTFQWQRDGENYGPAVVQTDHENHITVPMLEENSGTYTCVITNPSGTTVSEAALLLFRPSGTAIQRTPHRLVHPGDRLCLTTDVFTTSSVLKYEWQFNARKIPIVYPYATYHITSATYAHAGSYRLLTLTSKGTITSDYATLGVVEGADRRVVAVAGKPLTLTIKTAGAGLIYAWKRMDGQPLNPAHMTGISSPSLKIAKPSKEEHDGVYYCEVSRSDIATPLRSGLITVTLESEKPQMDPIELPVGKVALKYAGYQFKASHTPTRFNVSGLPGGLKCDPLSGIVSGMPITFGTFNVKVSATNPLGTSAVATVKLTVFKLDRELVSTFFGLMKAEGDEWAPFATCSLTVSESGHFTGKVGTTYDGYNDRINSGRLVTFTIAGELVQDETGRFTGLSSGYVEPNADTLTGPATHYLSLTWDAVNGMGCIRLSYNYAGSWKLPVALERNPWNSRTNPALHLTGYHTAEIAQPEVSPTSNAAGSGYAGFTVTTGGTFTFAGRLPDGSAFAVPAFLSKDGRVSLLTWLYGYKGQLAGHFSLSTGTPPYYRDSAVAGAMQWQRPPSTLVAKEGVSNDYFNGIDRVLAVRGARYLPPSLPLVTSPYMMNGQSPPPLNISLVAQGGGTDDTFFSDASLTTGHKASFPAWEPYRPMNFNSITFNPATGTFTGSATYLTFKEGSGAVLAATP